MTLERYVYDMGSSRGAFAVFSAQRRPEAEPLSLAPDAYRAGNGLFMAHGRFYVEIIAADLAAHLLSRMEDLARRFVDSHPQGLLAPDERVFLPAEDRLADGMSVIAANAFGIDGLDWIYTARYRRDAAEATAFVARRATGEEAEASAAAFAAYFEEFGGERISPPKGHPSLRAFAVFDSVEIVFALGPYLGGVHEAANREYAFLLAERLRRNLEEAGGGR
jgi:hypothetical protein